MEDIRKAWHPAVTHLNAAIDALLAPFRGADGNCRRANVLVPAELEAMATVRMLQAARDTHLDRMERLTRPTGEAKGGDQL